MKMSCLLAFVVAVSVPDLVFSQCQWAQRTPDASPSMRSAPAMAYDASRAVTVLFGGWTGTVPSINNETWEWNGSNWTQRFPADSPSPRVDCGMAYDAARGVTVLFGGRANDGGGSDLGDTWEWNGVNWLLRATGGPARQAHAMAYDAGRHVTVLFGGRNPNNDDTWEWDGTNWTQRSPATSPSARFAHKMAYDPVRGATVLFGGTNSTGAIFGDTWTWNGSVWTLVSNTGPSPRYAHGMAYDTSRAATVIFGGLVTPPWTYSGETWGWNGSSWTLQATTGPFPRFSFGMAYDVARNVSVLFGGSYQEGTPLGDTWELSCCGTTDTDGDGIPDLCDQCPFDPTNTKTPEGQCIPTVSQWGVFVMGLLVLTTGTMVVRRRGLNAP